MAAFRVTSQPPQSIHVLIAEDTPQVAEYVTAALESSPTSRFQFAYAEDLSSTLDMLQRATPDVLLLDLGLPDSDGLETFISVHEQAPHVPIVVSTGIADEELAVLALRHGAQDYLVKGQTDRLTLIKSLVYAVERRHAADKLRESEEMHRNVLESIPDIVCKLDVDGHILFTNQAVTSLGYAPHDLLGAPLSRIVLRDDLGRLEARIMRHVAQPSDAAEREDPFDLTYVNRAGEPVPVNASTAVLRNRRDEVAGVVVIARDVTKLKQLVADLERSREQLRERTAQLIQTAKVTALGDLAAGMAHEANQPLNAIKLTCGELLRDLALQRFDETDLRQGLEDISTEIDSLAELVEHMAQFSRASGSHLQVLEATAPIDGVTQLLGEQLRVQGIRLVLEVERGLRVRGNPARLQHAVMNVVTNAREATARNPPTIPPRLKIRVAPHREADVDFIVYEVDDNGPGIEDRHLREVLKPFFTTKRQGEGTGLGLSIAAQIVEEHGGRIELQSREGRGTTVRILVPAG